MFENAYYQIGSNSLKINAYNNQSVTLIKIASSKNRMGIFRMPHGGVPEGKNVICFQFLNNFLFFGSKNLKKI